VLYTASVMAAKLVNSTRRLLGRFGWKWVNQPFKKAKHLIS
jgi:hypothetical protein